MGFKSGFFLQHWYQTTNTAPSDGMTNLGEENSTPTRNILTIIGNQQGSISFPRNKQNKSQQEKTICPTTFTLFLYVLSS